MFNIIKFVSFLVLQTLLELQDIKKYQHYSYSVSTPIFLYLYFKTRIATYLVCMDVFLNFLLTIYIEFVEEQ